MGSFGGVARRQQMDHVDLFADSEDKLLQIVIVLNSGVESVALEWCRCCCPDEQRPV